MFHSNQPPSLLHSEQAPRAAQAEAAGCCDGVSGPPPRRREHQMAHLLPCLVSSVLRQPHVIASVDALFPSSAYNARRNLARDAALATAGRRTAEGIPLAGDAMVYGEFDVSFFARLLELAAPVPGETFVDLGSGVGRLVIAAALLYPRTWRNCQGVELSAPLHDAAIAARVCFEQLTPRPPIADCEFTCASVLDAGAGADALAAADVCFSYAVTWASGPEHDQLVRMLARHLPSGARVISVDLPLSAEAAASEDAQFELLHRVQGANEETGDQTVGFVYKLHRGQTTW
jgi:predicted RNA methylase